MFDKVSQTTILGLVAVTILALFSFLTVASVLDIPGVKAVDGSQFFSTIITLTAAIGGAAAAKFGGENSGKGPSA